MTKSCLSAACVMTTWLLKNCSATTALESSIRGISRALPSDMPRSDTNAVQILSTVPANPLPYHEFQPDGSLTPPLYFKGDGRGNYEHDDEGFVVMKNEEGWYVYAEEADQTADTGDGDVDSTRRLGGKRRLIPGKHRVGKKLDLTSVSVSSFVRGEDFYRGEHYTASSEMTSVVDHRQQSDPTSQQPSRQQQSSSEQTLHRFQRKLTTLGNFRSLIVLIRFKDHKFRDLPTKEQIENLYNHFGIHSEDAPTGSVREVFLQNSYGMLDATAYVTEWITVSKTEKYYANGEYGFERFIEAIEEAMNLFVESVIPNDLSEEDKELATKTLMDTLDSDGDGTIDGFGILHSGYGAEYAGSDCYNQRNENRIWSHQAGNLKYTNPKVNIQIPSQYYVASSVRNKCNSDIVRVGIVTHEIGHQLGLPDLYDKTWDGNGIGNYDMMSRCWGWDGSGQYPPMFSPWAKMELGWLTPTEITSTGQYALGPAAQVAEAFIIKEGYPEGEYLLIENRQPMGFDSMLPQGGLAIWHIDENVKNQNNRGFLGQQDWPHNGNHYKVALLQADGKQDLERKANNGDKNDLWHQDGENTVLGPSLGNDVALSTDSYQNGVVKETGLWIFGFSQSGDHMTFQVLGLQSNGVDSMGEPTPKPTPSPSSAPSLDPSLNPSSTPTTNPSTTPSSSPTSPTASPTTTPSASPSVSLNPTTTPTNQPSTNPTTEPSRYPTSHPSASPEKRPSLNLDFILFGKTNTVPGADNMTISEPPSVKPSKSPSASPSIAPSLSSSPSQPPSLSQPPTSSQSPSLPPIELPTALPTVDPQNVLYFHLDYVDMGCKRKPLSEYEPWEHARYISLGDCCKNGMPWDFNACIKKSVEFLSDRTTSVTNMASPPDV
ncbi:hypothetical protein ACHAXS_010075 [Conticribra weissflogii]